MSQILLLFFYLIILHHITIPNVCLQIILNFNYIEYIIHYIIIHAYVVIFLLL